MIIPTSRMENQSSSTPLSIIGEIGTLVDSKIYRITYIVDNIQKDNFLPILDQIINSFTTTNMTDNQKNNKTSFSWDSYKLKNGSNKYSINYEMKGLNNTLIEIRPLITQADLLFKIHAPNDGFLIVEMPRKLLDSKLYNNTDYKFHITTDNKPETFYEEINNDPNFRMLKIEINDDDRNIFVQGSQIDTGIPAYKNCINLLIPSTLSSASTNTETLKVIKNTNCQANTQICESNFIRPSQFNIIIEERNKVSTISFPGSSTGREVELESGSYHVTEQGLDLITPPLCNTMGFDAGRSPSDVDVFVCTNFSAECEGDLTNGNPRTCVIENVLMQNERDLAVVNRGSSDVSILLGNGNGTFGKANNFPVGSQPQSVVVGFFNTDFFQDLAVVNRGSSDVSILLGNGNGTFGTPNSFSVGGTDPTYIVSGFFDDDSAVDLVTANSISASILLGNGDGTFGTAKSFSVGENRPISIAVGDFNSDVKSDLAIAIKGSNYVSIRLGNGDGTFGTPNSFSVGSQPQSVVIGSFNGDGVLDLVTANSISDDVSILLGNGDGTFGTANNFSVGSQPQSVTVDDFNGDGLSDLVITKIKTNSVSILLGNGDGTFDTANNFITGDGPYTVALGYFD